MKARSSSPGRFDSRETKGDSLSTQDPRVAHDMFAQRALAAKAEKQQAKSAAAPRVAGEVG